MGGLGPLSGPLWVVLAALGASLAGLGPLLGHLWAILDSSWGLCGRSWAALKAFVGGLGLLSGPLWVVLGKGQAEKWPKPEQERDLGR